MTNFNKELDNLKRLGLSFNSEKYVEELQKTVNNLKYKVRTQKGVNLDVEYLMKNPQEIGVYIGKQWGYDVLKIFFVILSRDSDKLGRNDMTNMNRTKIFYYTLLAQHGSTPELECIYMLLLITALEYEKEHILSFTKKNRIVHSPIYSLKFFGFKKSTLIYKDIVGRFAATPKGKILYTAKVPQINHIGLLKAVWGMEEEEAKRYLSEQTNGLLLQQLPLDVEEELLPYILSEEGVLFLRTMNGVLKDYLLQVVDDMISARGGHVAKMNTSITYLYNSNPYTILLSEYKIAHMDNLIQSLSMEYPEIEFTFVTDSDICFLLPEQQTPPTYYKKAHIQQANEITFLGC